MDTLLQADYALFRFINDGLTSGILDFVLVPMRHPLFWIPLYVFIISYFVINYGRKAYWTILFMVLTVGTADIISARVIKPFFVRLRPCNNEELTHIISRIDCGSGFSFVSSHATNHFALAVFLILIYTRMHRRYKYLLISWASVICLAQVYVGVHFPMDVLCGAILGSLIAFCWTQLYHKVYDSLADLS